MNICKKYQYGKEMYRQDVFSQEKAEMAYF